MLMAEWDTKEFGKVQREEGRAEVRAESIQYLCQAIKYLMNMLGKSFEEAVAILGLPEDQIDACRPHCKL